MTLAQIITAWHRKKWPVPPLFTLAWIVEAKQPVTYVEIRAAMFVGQSAVEGHINFLVERGFVTRTKNGPRGPVGAPACLVTPTKLSLDILTRRAAALPEDSAQNTEH